MFTGGTIWVLAHGHMGSTEGTSGLGLHQQVPLQQLLGAPQPPIRGQGGGSHLGASRGIGNWGPSESYGTNTGVLLFWHILKQTYRKWAKSKDRVDGNLLWMDKIHFAPRNETMAETITCCCYLQGNHHARVSWVVRNGFHPSAVGFRGLPLGGQPGVKIDGTNSRGDDPLGSAVTFTRY